MESIQYNAALAITDAIRGTSREKLYRELGLESLRKRQWYRKLCYFFKIYKSQSLVYIIKELIITFPLSVVNIIFLEIHFFHQLPLNGITET